MTPLRVVILGGGTAGWIAANLIAKIWADRPVTITAIESRAVGIIGVGEGSTPQLKNLFDRLGIAEAEWMPACNATYKAGISFHGWSDRPGFASYFHPFASSLDDRTQPAHFLASHMRRSGLDVPAHPDAFYLSARLAREKLAPLPARNFPFDVGYGYHFDAHLVGAFLRERAIAQGVVHRDATIAHVALAASGDVAALVTEDGERIAGDLFVDASGFRGMILQQALGVPFIAFAENLFNDAAVVMPTPPAPGDPPCETRATALTSGWAWSIPLTNRTGNGYVYSTRYTDPQAAEIELRRHLGLLDSAVPARHLAMKVGRVARHWERNVLAVGLSQGFIEPLEATALHLVQATVEGFLEQWDAQGRDTFNATINARFEGVRDYIVAHYRMSKRSDTDYWRDSTTHENLSDSLKAIITCWFTGGDLPREIADQDIARYYSAMSWHCLLGGHGNFPARLQPPPPQAPRIEMAVIDDFLARCALNFPRHADALQALAA